MMSYGCQIRCFLARKGPESKTLIPWRRLSYCGKCTRSLTLLDSGHFYRHVLLTNKPGVCYLPLSSRLYQLDLKQSLALHSKLKAGTGTHVICQEQGWDQFIDFQQTDILANTSSWSRPKSQGCSNHLLSTLVEYFLGLAISS